MDLHKAVIHVPLEREQALTLEGSLRPESRFETEMVFDVSANDEGVVMNFEAGELSELRAAINSYMRLVLVAMSVTKQGR